MTYDVVVVGAGPAGATAAKVLAEKGRSVLLLDKSKFPREKPCGGGLPVKVLKRFPYIETSNLIDSYSCDGFVYSRSLQHKVTIKRTEPLIAMILRNTFDAGLVKLAVQASATFQENTKVSHVNTHEKNVQVVLAQGPPIDASYAIIADGWRSSVAKQAGKQQKRTDCGVCVFQEYPLPQSTMDELFGASRPIHIHLTVLGITGYGWVFPKRECVNIGLCEFRHVPPPQRTNNLNEQFIQYLRLLIDSHVLPKDFPTNTPTQGGVFPTCALEPLATKRMLLCGDAGGLVNPLTGDGIYSAMISGELAAETLHQALTTRTGTYNLSLYQKRLNQTFGNDYKRLFRFSNGWARNPENLVRIFSKDTTIVNIALNAVTSTGTIQTYRTKLFSRLLWIYLKDRLGMRK